jgi:RimJ/RimL family protein N-acetyltransferase
LIAAKQEKPRNNAMRMPTLETKRLLIRPLTEQDTEVCHRLYVDIAWTDPALSEQLNLAKRRAWVEWSVRNYEALAALDQPPYGDRAVVLKSGEFVGLVGLVPLLAPFAQLPTLGGTEQACFSAEVGLFWAISPVYQRRGYASEAASALVAWAFRELRLARILAGTEHENHASTAVMKKLNMRIERNPYSEPAWFQTVGLLDRASASHIASASNDE